MLMDEWTARQTERTDWMRETYRVFVTDLDLQYLQTGNNWVQQGMVSFFPRSLQEKEL